MDTCLFCANPEIGHPATVDYVCSGCVIKLMAIDGKEGRKLFEKARAKNNMRQCRGITLVKGIR